MTKIPAVMETLPTNLADAKIGEVPNGVQEQRYLDEQAFRFNNRKTYDPNRFGTVLSRVVGRRLTWRRLCGVDGAGFMGLE
jgi:hypothetical protein